MYTYVHTGGVSNAYWRIRTARARVHGDAMTASCSLAANRLGRNGETASSCSSGANRLGRNSRSKRGPTYHRTEETTLCSTGHGRNGILFIGTGLAYRKTEETDFSWTSHGRNG